jgi:hypothetical protein
MSRIITIGLVGLASFLLVRAGQIHRNVWRAAESRKDLLAHFVDHTKTLTEREIHEARFWSGYGQHSSQTFTWYVIGGLCALGAADWLDRRTRRAKRQQEIS